MIEGQNKEGTVYDIPTDEFEPISTRKVSQTDLTFERLSRILNILDNEIGSDEDNPLKGTVDYIKSKIRAAEERNVDSEFIAKQIIIQTRALVKALGLTSRYSNSLLIEINSLAEEIDFKTPTY